MLATSLQGVRKKLVASLQGAYACALWELARSLWGLVGRLQTASGELVGEPVGELAGSLS